MTTHIQERVIQAAIAARERAYAPYSKFLVGAALLTPEGEIFTGCNVENASYGLTICAERAAVFTAIAAGRRNFAFLAIATTGAAAPCGACRQVLTEFAPELPIVLIDVDRVGAIVEVQMQDLLPGAFRLTPGV
jgi:cytidine deaminase